MKLKRFIVPLLASLALIGGVATSLFIARPVSADSYPILPTGVAYYKTTYPVGLTYSQGWYGTMTKAPAGAVIYLYDDTNGICLFSEPIGAQSVPSGAQTGTSITPISITTAQALINSYPTSAYTAITPAVESTMTALDYYQGVWEGAKLAQKWDTPQATTETILTPAQVTTHNNQQTNIVATLDPPRYFVLPTGNSNWSSTGTWDSLTSVYSTGTATFTNASTDVTGSGTTWTSGMNGDYIVSTTNTLYKISTVNSTTDLTLTGNYVQPTLSGVAYIIGTLATTASVPTSADSVYAGTIATGATLTVDAGASCLNMDWTGATNTPTFTVSGYLNPYGTSLTLIANMVISSSGNGIAFYNNSNTINVTTNGCAVNCGIVIGNPFTGIVNLQDNLNTTQLYLGNGTLATNNHTVTCTNFRIEAAGAKTLNLGSSTINCTVWGYTGTNLTLTANTSTINCSGNFTGGGITTYNIVNLTGATSTISGSNTFAQLNGNPAITQTFNFTDGTTQTVTASNLSGSAGHVHTLTGTSTGGWSLAKTGGGTVFADYVNITYSTVPANTFYYGANSTYNSTSGWTEAVLPTITLSAASSIATTTAQLNGNITNLNGSGVGSTVSIYYGTSDGLKVPASWTNTVVPTSPSQPQGVAAFYYSTTGLTAGTTYYFSASASNPAGTAWVTASLNFLTIPAAPTGVSASTNQTGYITISWTGSTGASGYNVYYNGGASASGVLGIVSTYNDTNAPAGTITAGTTTATQNTSLTIVTMSNAGESGNNGASTTYNVTAINPSGESAHSSTATGNRIVGAISYQGQRSAADTDASYSNLLGATTSPFDDTNPAPLGQKRFYRYQLSATGATTVYSTAQEGWIFYMSAPTGLVVVVSNNNSTISWTPDANATDTVLVQGVSSFPLSATDGVVIYNGTGSSYTFANGNTEISTQYISAFSYYSGFGGIYSTDYAKTTTGGRNLTLIIIGFLILIVILVFIFAKG